LDVYEARMKTMNQYEAASSIKESQKENQLHFPSVHNIGDMRSPRKPESLRSSIKGESRSFRKF
jgi:hypothetical protein